MIAIPPSLNSDSQSPPPPGNQTRRCRVRWRGRWQGSQRASPLRRLTSPKSGKPTLHTPPWSRFEGKYLVGVQGMLPDAGSILRGVHFWEVPFALIMSPGWVDHEMIMFKAVSFIFSHLSFYRCETSHLTPGIRGSLGTRGPSVAGFTACIAVAAYA